MSINWPLIRATCLAYATSTGRLAIWSDQSAPKPARPYVLLKLTPVSTPPFYETRQGDNPGEFVHGAIKELSLSVQVVASVSNEGGSVHMEEADKLVDKLAFEGIKRIFALQGIAIIEATPILDLTEYLETAFEPKAAFDVRMTIASNSLESLAPADGQVIETVELTDEIRNEVQIIDSP